MINQQANYLANLLQQNPLIEDEVSKATTAFFEAIHKAPEDERDALTEQSMQTLCSVFNFNNPMGTRYASLICGNLIENGFNSRLIIDQHIHFIHQIISKIQPLVNQCKEAIQNNTTDEVDDIEIIDQTIENLKTEFKEEVDALNLLDEYYTGAIPAFAFNKETLTKAKQELSHIAEFEMYSVGFHWLSKLLAVLVDEPIVAIDLDSQKGIMGKMNGVTDNYQLQWLLMGLPELNDEMQITPEQLDVIKGISPKQSLNETIEGKWNMYQWTYINNPHKDTRNTEDWIWGEGIPTDIFKHKQYRVVLLGKPAYSRTAHAQRTFNNLVATIEVEKNLTKQEIEAFLNNIKSSIK